MAYGESLFDILYLLFAIISGIVMLVKARTGIARKMGAAALILGVGDAFHLVPRVLRYFTDLDLTAALGIGKLITSITMTVFYVLLYAIWVDSGETRPPRALTATVWGLAAVRVALCMLPQNEWLQNSSDWLWGTIRNIPFAALGAIIVVLYFRRRHDRRFQAVWLLVLLSFLFYLPVAIGASFVPLLGMLMLPKTVCYILLIGVFLSAVRRENASA